MSCLPVGLPLLLLLLLLLIGLHIRDLIRCWCTCAVGRVYYWTVLSLMCLLWNKGRALSGCLMQTHTYWWSGTGLCSFCKV